jgi:hypothetical protein
MKHILSNGDVVSQTDIEERLLGMTGARDADLFLLPEERLSEAYRQRARKVAFAEPALASATGS